MTSHDVVARTRRARSAPARSATPARSTRWRPACSSSASTARRACSPTSSGSTRSTRRRSGSAPSTTTDDAEGELVSEADATGDRPRRPDATRRRSPPSPARSSRCRARSAPSRSTASARTPVVRAGEEVELTARPVTVSRVRGARSSASRRRRTSTSTCAVECSSGTYIRALARDLGAAPRRRRTPDRAATHAHRSVRGRGCRAELDDRRRRAALMPARPTSPPSSSRVSTSTDRAGASTSRTASASTCPSTRRTPNPSRRDRARRPPRRPRRVPRRRQRTDVLVNFPAGRGAA